MSSGILRALKTIKNHPYTQYVGLGLAGLITREVQDGARKSKQQLIRLSTAVFGIELCYAAETAFVSPVLLKLGVPVSLMTLVWCVSPVLGFFLVPIMGSLSDRCPFRLGRRRPFILLMSAGIIIGLLLVPNGESLGMLLGDTGNEILHGHIGRNVSIISADQTTSNETTMASLLNSTVATASYQTTEKFSVSNEHLIGILLTIFGVAFLDFNCDACQSPCRAYLLDVTVPEDHSAGLTMFTVMAGIGGSIGYVMGGIDWNSTSFGTAFGGHIRVVFFLVLVVFVLCVVSTVTSVREMPLYELGITCVKLQNRKKKVGKSKYRQFTNESDDYCEEEKSIETEEKMYGSITDSLSISNKIIVPNSQSGENIDQNYGSSNNLNSTLEDEPENTIEISTDVTLKTYIKSIWNMPWSLFILCVTNLFCWMSLVCYSLYFTDFVGQSVFEGDPKAPVGSDSHNRYDEGVRLGSFGMSLYSLSCALYSLSIESLVRRFGARNVYVYGQLTYSIGMIILAISRHKVAVIILSPSAGIMYATLFTMPYLLVAQYHTKGMFSTGKPDNREQIRGLGTDVALVSSMVFLAQFLLSICVGSIIGAVKDTVAVIAAAAILSFLGALSATRVVYLDL